MYTPTKKTHYNPCFWTACWSPGYLDALKHESENRPPSRRAKVYALSAKANKIFPTTVENVHFEKGLGIAEIDRNEAVRFCQRYFPDERESFTRRIADAEYPVFIDFENHFDALEKTPAYESALEVAQKKTLDHPEEKCNLACFVFLQRLRSHAVMNSSVELLGESRRFEYCWLLKQLLGNPSALMEQIVPLVNCKWTLHRSSEDILPLCDCPVLSKGANIAPCPRVHSGCAFPAALVRNSSRTERLRTRLAHKAGTEHRKACRVSAPDNRKHIP